MMAPTKFIFGSAIFLVILQIFAQSEAWKAYRDPCQSYWCQNGGTCKARFGRAYCVCPQGYQGTKCQYNKVYRDPCQSYGCQNGGTCKTRFGRAYCVCPQGYKGTKCQYKKAFPRDPCENLVCENGGTCTAPSGQPVCNCPLGFTGIRCQNQIVTRDPCQNFVCENGGTCTAPADRPFCNCPPGFRGQRCQNPIVPRDPCQNFVCENGGTCTAPDDRPYCNCPPGFRGLSKTHRHVTRDPCRNFVCENGGTCTAPADRPFCNCPPGFRGRRCQIPIVTRDPCRNFVCENGGTCTAPADRPFCNCPPGFRGRRCQIPIVMRDPCQNFVCENGGNCTAPADFPFCNCPPGYTGQRCENLIIIIDPCAGFQCMNGGFCVAPADAPMCRCLAGFTGARCESSTNVDRPGTCPDIEPGQVGVCGGTFCTSDSGCPEPQKCCPSACGGNLCTAVNLNPCRNFVCQNGGTCTAPAGRPICKCLPGYTGRLCENRTPPPPLTCRNAKCSLGFTCRIMLPCETCQLGPNCIPNENLPDAGIDAECQNRNYLRAVLVPGMNSDNQHLALGCSGDPTVVDCPSGSVCVPRDQGRGLCCEGKPDPQLPKPGTCPAPGDFGVCDGRSCELDAQCPGNEKCCDSPCGQKYCRDPATPPPRITCANVLCNPGSDCRMVLPCATCAPEPRCFDLDVLGEDRDIECRRQNYRRVLLVDSQTTPVFYSQLKCRGPLMTRDCPTGFDCVDDLRGGGTCCEGRSDLPLTKPGVCPTGDLSVCGGVFCTKDYDCPGKQKCCPGCGNLCTEPEGLPATCGSRTCPPGQVCIQRPAPCKPGFACIQVLLPTCVPADCANCRPNDECKLQPGTTKYQCVPRSQCGANGPCPPGQRCVEVKPHVLECRPDDMCGGCRKGEVCINTDIRCTTEPCDTYQCVKNNLCRGCPPGQKCALLPTPCAAPPDCDAIRALDPTAECIIPECNPLPSCVDESASFPSDECGLCPKGQVCVDTGIRCVTEPCDSFKCVPEDKCGGCPPGKKCELLPTPCLPPCDYARENGLSEDDCSDSPCLPQPVCVVDPSFIPEDECGGCPPGKRCELLFPPCPQPPDCDAIRALDPDAECIIFECKPIPSCVDDTSVSTNPCGSCPKGDVCIDTGIRCVTQPCPTYQCVKNNLCGGCPPGQKCALLPTPCAAPPDCDAIRALDPNAECIIPECNPLPSCVDESASFPSDECGLCPKGQVCVDTGIRCVTEPCDSFKCVPEDKCGGCPPGKKCELLPTPCLPPCEYARENSLSEDDCSDSPCLPQPVCVVDPSFIPEDECGGCPPGKRCELLFPPCPQPPDCDAIRALDPDAECIIFECKPIPSCVDDTSVSTNPCGSCPKGDVCIDTGIRCVTQPCPTYQCVKNNICGGCPPGQKCALLPTPCAAPPDCDAIRALDPDAECIIPECNPLPSCVDESASFPSDECGLCPKGQVCVDTGIRCVTEPCDSFKCAPEDKCGGCPPGKKCELLPTPCLPPCDYARENGLSEDDCSDSPCLPQPVCVTDPSFIPPPPPPVCPFRCPHNHVCKFVKPVCSGGYCDTTPVPSCVPVYHPPSNCPQPSKQLDPKSPTCLTEQQSSYLCHGDSDCPGPNKRCCLSKCGRKICLVVG